MHLRIAGGPRIGEQERKRKVLAAKIGAATRGRVGDRAGFEEPVQLHIRPAAKFNVGYQPALFWDVNRQDAQRRHRRDYSRLFGRRRTGGSDTRSVVDGHVVYSRNGGRSARSRIGNVYQARRVDGLVVIGLRDYAL